MTVFKYINKQNNSLIGYHLSTMCQAGSLERAKRYSCKTEEEIASQKAVIQNNFNVVINSTPENQVGKIFDLNVIRETYFPNLTQNDVELQYETVPDIDITYTVHTVITDKK